MECVRRSIKESRGSVRPHDETSYDVLCAELRRDAHDVLFGIPKSPKKGLIHVRALPDTKSQGKKGAVASCTVAT